MSNKDKKKKQENIPHSETQENEAIDTATIDSGGKKNNGSKIQNDAKPVTDKVHGNNFPDSAIVATIAIVVGIIVLAVVLSIVVRDTKGEGIFSVPNEGKATVSVETDETNGQYFDITHREKTSSATPILEVYLEPQCPTCHGWLVQESQRIKDAVDSGNIRLHVHMVDFMDKNYGNQVSQYALSAMLGLADLEDKSGLWDFIGLNGKTILDDYDIKDLKELSSKESQDIVAEELKKNGLEDVISGVYDDKFFEEAEQMSESNMKAMKDRTGEIATPTVFVSGEVVLNPMDGSMWGLLENSNIPDNHPEQG